MSFRKFVYRILKKILEPLGITVKLQPRATMTMRVYRASTGKWETIKVKNLKVSQEVADKLKQETENLKEDR
jgi:hypothetical protein